MLLRNLIRRLTEIRSPRGLRKATREVPETWTSEGQVLELRNFFAKEERRLKRNRDQQKEKGVQDNLQLQRKLRRALGIENSDGFDIQRVEIKPLSSSFEKDNAGTLHNVCISLTNGISIRGILGLPKNLQNTRLPALVCLHGARSRPEILFDIDESQDAKHRNKGYEKKYALELLRDGYIVFAPYLINDFGQQLIREKLDLAAIPLGYRFVGIEVIKVLRSISFLSDHSQVCQDRIGIFGVSNGGTIALWSAALDDRVKVTVLSNSLYNGYEGGAAVGHRIRPASVSVTGKHSELPFGYLSTFCEDTLIRMLDGRYLFLEMGEHDYKTKEACRYSKLVSHRLRGTSAEKYFGYASETGKGHEVALNKSRKFISEHL